MHSFSVVFVCKPVVPLGSTNPEKFVDAVVVVRKAGWALDANAAMIVSCVVPWRLELEGHFVVAKRPVPSLVYPLEFDAV